LRQLRVELAPLGPGFQVVEDLFDGSLSSVEGFSTEADAKGWLDGFLVLIALVEYIAATTLY
jgi:hypothetical protein